LKGLLLRGGEGREGMGGEGTGWEGRGGEVSVVESNKMLKIDPAPIAIN